MRFSLSSNIEKLKELLPMKCCNKFAVVLRLSGGVFLQFVELFVELFKKFRVGFVLRRTIV